MTTQTRFFLVVRPWYRAWRLVWLLLWLPLPVCAWNAAGHRLVAAIAWDQLDDADRSEIAQLLHAHPDYARWLKRAGNKEWSLKETTRVAFIESSTWPDDIRKDRRFYDADRDQATELIPGFPDMERHRDWHFVNRPLDGTPPDPSLRDAARGQLDRQLEVLSVLFGSRNTTLRDRAYFLPWLVHLVGDAHQPLHACARPETEDILEDRVSVTHAYRSRPQSTTLHAFWDDLPGPPWLRGEQLDVAYSGLLARYPRPVPSPSKEWIDESWQIAKRYAYPPKSGSQYEITADFMEQSRDIAYRRVTEAGYRLADLLRKTLRRKS